MRKVINWDVDKDRFLEFQLANNTTYQEIAYAMQARYNQHFHPKDVAGRVYYLRRCGKEMRKVYCDKWPKEEEQYLCKVYGIKDEKLGRVPTVVEICDMMRREFGSIRTRSAIIGKAKRLKLQTTARRPILSTKYDLVYKHKQKLLEIQESKETPDMNFAVVFTALNAYQCRYMYGRGIHSLCCGKPIADGAYCEHHARIDANDQTALFCKSVKGLPKKLGW